MFDHPFDNLGVTFSEGRHQTGNLSVVLRVDVGSGRVEKLDDLEMTTIGCKPKTRIAFLVAHINLKTIKIIVTFIFYKI